MPYASEKQRGYLHAVKPEVAARFDADIRAKKKGQVAKAKKDWALGLSTATVGGALANQVPAIRPKRKKKGQIKKMLVPASGDPNFNQEAAQRAFDLVMKMDDDTAEMFVHVVVSDYFEETVEKNLGTLQRHLNEVLGSQLADLKRAHLRLVSKGMDAKEAIAYAEAISQIEAMLVEPISKIGAAQKYGYQWEESDFARDPSSGQFRTKIKRAQHKEIKNSVFEQIHGVKTPKTVRGNKLSEEDRVRFQDEYRQLSSFLQTVKESTGGKGNQEVMLHYTDNKGNTFSQIHLGTKPPMDDLADPSFRLTGAEAKPTTLTAGGAAFGLASSLGGGMTPGQVKGINAIESGGGSSFASKWTAAGSDRNTNEQLYGRLAASGELLQAVGSGNPKMQLAGKFAQIVGSAGPQAEMVLGPGARKTAYRYRGTEKTPEKDMVRAYGEGVTQGKTWGLQAEDEQFGVKVPRRAPKQGAVTPAHKIGQEREATANRAPTWAEREVGRRNIVSHLWNKRPQKSLYELHLAAGNTPPSEGVILNADGQLVTQAVGYGDDHYLPFNLKNLKGLKGGEYIRTRSVGGLTSEDIYTGLISGARQVTVVSRSGTYTVTFEPDFRGGRRHNDKARRMTRRYEQLLDAVQSQQVDRIDIDPEMRQQIENEVKEEMPVGPGSSWRRSDQMEAVKERIDEFKANPYITEEDEKRADAIINARSANASDSERAKIRAQVMDDLLDQKEVKFRLNSAGYKAAQEALQEQFPYYVSKPRWTPPTDAEKKLDPTIDRGYVEPGRNRPTAAAAGLFGVASAGKFAGKGGKFSARDADYQGGRSNTQAAAAAGAAGATAAGGLTPDKESERKKKALISEEKSHQELSAAAKAIQDHAAGTLNAEALEKNREEMQMTGADLKDRAKLEKFKTFATRLFATPDAKTPYDMKVRWEAAIGNRDRQPFDEAKADEWPKYAAKFDDGDAYHAGASKKDVTRELDRLDRSTKASLKTNKPLSSLTDVEMAAEHEVLNTLYRLRQSQPDVKLRPEDFEALQINPTSGGLKSLKTADGIKARMIELHRTRALVTGMSAEDRGAREHAAQVVRGEPATPEERSEAFKNAISNAKYAEDIARKLEDQEGFDEEEVNVIRHLADELRNNADDIRTPDDLSQFMAKPDRVRARDILIAAADRLHKST